MKNVLIFLTFIFVSCASLGSKTNIKNGDQLKNIKTVGLITQRYDQPKNEYHKLIKEAFTKTLLNELQTANLFKIVIIDTLENEKLKIDTIRTNPNYDAILLAKWKLKDPLQTVTDATVELSILDKNTKEVIVESTHATTFNSYWSLPILPRTLIDATEDVVKTFKNNIKKKTK